MIPDGEIVDAEDLGFPAGLVVVTFSNLSIAVDIDGRFVALAIIAAATEHVVHRTIQRSRNRENQDQRIESPSRLEVPGACRVASGFLDGVASHGGPRP